jgi:hypothetical protein
MVKNKLERIEKKGLYDDAFPLNVRNSHCSFAHLTGILNRQFLFQNEYAIAENRILRCHETDRCEPRFRAHTRVRRRALILSPTRVHISLANSFCVRSLALASMTARTSSNSEVSSCAFLYRESFIHLRR